MYYVIIGHSLLNEIQTITQVFYPNEKFVRVDVVSGGGITAVSKLSADRCLSEVLKDGVSLSRYETPFDGEAGYIVKKCMFLCLIAANGYIPVWGMLTGIRPSKLAHTLRECGFTDNEIISHLADKYFVSRMKSELCLRVADAEEKIITRASGGYSVYIGIPFCPSRCLYCSFTSQPIGKSIDLVDRYLAALEKELSRAAEYMNGKVPDAIYIGGGTPTSLDASRLERLLDIVERVLPNRAEYTVEAGRPDTIDRVKIRLLKSRNVTRLSINPQTMNDKTLKLIGRGHTCAQFLDAFEMARSEGHGNINIDLILGLPGEDENDVQNSIEGVLALLPENLTVHTLAVKRASRLKEELHSHELTDGGIENMLKVAKVKTISAGMYPYYMYRQKNMLGNFENIGYTLTDFGCIYNVMIMAERQTILAFGAGAITKTINNAQQIERIFNVKTAEEYILRIDEMIERKEEWFYGNGNTNASRY